MKKTKLMREEASEARHRQKGKVRKEEKNHRNGGGGGGGWGGGEKREQKV